MMKIKLTSYGTDVAVTVTCHGEVLLKVAAMERSAAYKVLMTFLEVKK